MLSLLEKLTEGEMERHAADEDWMGKLETRWAEIKSDPDWVDYFLLRQYTGENEALNTMVSIIDEFGHEASSQKERDLVEMVIAQEREHVSMISKLLESRGTPARMIRCGKPLPGMTSFELASATTSRAEAARAAEIRLALGDDDLPDDVREVFERILREEMFHEKAFRELAGQESMDVTECTCSGWCDG